MQESYNIKNHFAFPLLHLCLRNKDPQQQRNSEQCPFAYAKPEKPRWMDGDSNAHWSQCPAAPTFCKGKGCLCAAHTQLLLMMPRAGEQKCCSPTRWPCQTHCERNNFCSFMKFKLLRKKKKNSRDHWSQRKDSHFITLGLGSKHQEVSTSTCKPCF